MDLLQDGEQGDGGLPQYYQPEPFIVPDPTVASTRPSTDGRRHSAISNGASELGVGRAHTPTAQSTSTRKSAAPPSFRPVNIIQHDDAGPSEEPALEPETVELPPAYTNIKKNGSPPPPAAPHQAAPVA